MIALPRALVAFAIVSTALAQLPLAAASDCVELNTATFSEGFRVIANAGRQVALGFRSGTPGDGVAFVVIITPAVCTGLGVSPSESSAVREQAPSFLPLP